MDDNTCQEISDLSTFIDSGHMHMGGVTSADCILMSSEMITDSGHMHMGGVTSADCILMSSEMITDADNELLQSSRSCSALKEESVRYVDSVQYFTSISSSLSNETDHFADISSSCSILNNYHDSLIEHHKDVLASPDMDADSETHCNDVFMPVKVENVPLIQDYFDVQEEVIVPHQLGEQGVSASTWKTISMKLEKLEDNIMNSEVINNMCNKCGMSFKTPRQLHIHLDNHHIRHKCISCGVVLADKKSLSEHVMEVHRPEDVPGVLCLECGRRCKDQRGFHKHSFVHFEEGDFFCNMCDKQFFSRARLKRHMLSHRDKAVTCAECGKEMPDSRALANHRASHNAQQVTCEGIVAKIFPCHVCNKVFGSRSSQQIHVRIHTGEKPYGCRYCWKAFADGGTLRKHERIHTGEKPYACPICPKAFNQRVVLREHIKSHHAVSETKGSNSYKCTVCGNMCASSADLWTHLVKHSDENTAKHRIPVATPRKYKRRRRKIPEYQDDNLDVTDPDDVLSKNLLLDDDFSTDTILDSDMVDEDHMESLSNAELTTLDGFQQFEENSNTSDKRKDSPGCISNSKSPDVNYVHFSLKSPEPTYFHSNSKSLDSNPKSPEFNYLCANSKLSEIEYVHFNTNSSEESYSKSPDFNSRTSGVNYIRSNSKSSELNYVCVNSKSPNGYSNKTEKLLRGKLAKSFKHAKAAKLLNNTSYASKYIVSRTLEQPTNTKLDDQVVHNYSNNIKLTDHTQSQSEDNSIDNMNKTKSPPRARNVNKRCVKQGYKNSAAIGKKNDMRIIMNRSGPSFDNFDICIEESNATDHSSITNSQLLKVFNDGHVIYEDDEDFLDSISSMKKNGFNFGEYMIKIDEVDDADSDTFVNLGLGIGATVELQSDNLK